ncbi:hypothetical protein AX774_g5149 [Zancudomyces culisetae]|uniref:Uncharacterized protein n=1 Tax=Zancudomyces culisetae TaxID=1213189 RepID=A0A1R1PKE5_ZANCU|nr:hypothetical protein AX774_g5149 [Zancudomyces culisetae]|eukprot:OMH81393.1 hypothetical protein AX774_g5149 [Zancudomyces culisetae]
MTLRHQKKEKSELKYEHTVSRVGDVVLKEKDLDYDGGNLNMINDNNNNNNVVCGEFVIENVFYVPMIGNVAVGQILNGSICTNNESKVMEKSSGAKDKTSYLGPDKQGLFYRVKVASIHRHGTPILRANSGHLVSIVISGYTSAETNNPSSAPEIRPGSVLIQLSHSNFGTNSRHPTLQCFSPPLPLLLRKRVRLKLQAHALLLERVKNNDYGTLFCGSVRQWAKIVHLSDYMSDYSHALIKQTDYTGSGASSCSSLLESLKLSLTQDSAPTGQQTLLSSSSEYANSSSDYSSTLQTVLKTPCRRNATNVTTKSSGDKATVMFLLTGGYEYIRPNSPFLFIKDTKITMLGMIF